MTLILSPQGPVLDGAAGQCIEPGRNGSVELESVPTAQLLRELVRRGGHPGAVAEAIELCIRKSEDYNQGMGTDPHSIIRDVYFPFGLKSYTQMLHTKTQRLISLCQKDSGATFESAKDTCLDLINYAGFCIDWLNRKGKE